MRGAGQAAAGACWSRGTLGTPWPGGAGSRGTEPGQRHPTLETGYVSLSRCSEPRGEILAGN